MCETRNVVNIHAGSHRGPARDVGERRVGLDGSHQIINAGKELLGEGGVDIYQSAIFCPGSQIRKRYRWYLNTEEVTNSNQCLNVAMGTFMLKQQCLHYTITHMGGTAVITRAYFKK